MAGVKRDRNGNSRPDRPPKEVVRNAFTPMFERFRDQLDEHHDRRERLVKASRDITALSKKIIFSLQRVRKIQSDLPPDVDAEVRSRLAEVARLLRAVAPDVRRPNRWRYARSMMCIEELVEALTFAHYLRTQTLMGYDEAAAAVAELSLAPPDPSSGDSGAAAEAAVSSCGEEQMGGDCSSAASAEEPVSLTEDDYVMGILDLTGEMMRFATTTAALIGELASAAGRGHQQETPRTIVADMQGLGSFFEMLPPRGGRQLGIKMEVLRASVGKVERLGYGLAVRGGERPKGWMPDDDDGGGLPPSP